MTKDGYLEDKDYAEATTGSFGSEQKITPNVVEASSLPLHPVKMDARGYPTPDSYAEATTGRFVHYGSGPSVDSVLNSASGSQVDALVNQPAAAASEQSFGDIHNDHQDLLGQVRNGVFEGTVADAHGQGDIGAPGYVSNDGFHAVDRNDMNIKPNVALGETNPDGSLKQSFGFGSDGWGLGATVNPDDPSSALRQSFGENSIRSGNRRDLRFASIAAMESPVAPPTAGQPVAPFAAGPLLGNPFRSKASLSLQPFRSVSSFQSQPSTFPRRPTR